MPQATTWQKSLKKASFPKLSATGAFDVGVVGGGLAGLFCAYRLSQKGKSVAVLEAAEIGQGATAQTTAFITQDIDTDLSELIKIFGKAKARLVWESGAEAIKSIADVIAKEKIECDFMLCPLNIYAQSEGEFELLKKEHVAAKNLGFKTLLKQKEGLEFKNAGFWAIPQQAKFHPLKFLYGLAKAAQNSGAQIFENSKVTAIEREESLLVVKTKTAKVLCKNVVIATYDPLGNPWATKFKKGMYKSYVFEVQLPKGRLKEALYLDLKNPYHYLRVDALDKFDRLIIGGEDHRSELPVSSRKQFLALEDYLKKLLPKTNYKITNRWVGPILEPSDGLPLIGEVKPGQFVASVFSGNGMTYSAAAADLITDLILNKANPYEELYRPARIPTLKQLLTKGKDYTEELVKGAIKNTVKY